MKSLLLQLNKQLGRFEVIIVDDASIDDTNKMIKDYVSQLTYDLTYILIDKHVGLPSARNIGIKHSNYKIIGFLDDDCFPTRFDLLERAYRWLKLENQNIVGVGGPVYDKLNYSTSKNLKINFIRDLFNIKKIIRVFFKNIELLYRPRKLSYVTFLAGGNCFFKKEFVNKCGGFDPKFDGNYVKEDTDFSMRIKKFGKLINDSNMAVNHLKVNFGGCRCKTEDYYYDLFSNTVLILMKNKRISVEIILGIFLIIIGYLKKIIVGFDENRIVINRFRLLRSLFSGSLYGLKKFFYSKNLKIQSKITEIYKKEN